MPPALASWARLGCIAACTVTPACERDTDSGACDPGGAEPALDVAPNRLSPDALQDGAELPVFNPPQGGVFTELDVSVRGIATEDLLSIGFVVTRDDDDIIANQRYMGAGLPLMCQSDGSQRIPDVPVGFDLDVVLLDLEGVPARLEAVVETPDGDVEASADVVLRVIEF